MTLDMIDADCFGDSRLLIKIEQVTLQVRVIDDASQVAFEMAVINHVEPDQRAKQSPVGFDDSITKQVSAF